MGATISLIKDDGIDVDLCDTELLLNGAIETGFAAKQLRPNEFGRDMGTRAITAVVSEILTA